MKEFKKVSKEKIIGKLQQTKKKIFIAPNIIIAGGVGSFEPRKFLIKDAEKFENKAFLFS